MIDAFEIVKVAESPSPLIILETLLHKKGSLQFYFHSTLKRKILRKKQENVGGQFAIQYIRKLSRKTVSPQMMVLQYKEMNDKRASFNIMGCLEAEKLIQNKKQHESWMAISLDKLENNFQLIMALWNQNYCVCQEFVVGRNDHNLGLNLSVSIKSSIGVICDAIAKSAQKHKRAKTKQMEIVFLKPNNASKVYLLFVKKLQMGESDIINLSFGDEPTCGETREAREESLSEQKQQPQFKRLRVLTPSRIRCKNSPHVFCASCRRTNLPQFKQIPSHSVYKIQLKHSTGKRTVSQRQDNIQSMYDFSKVCNDCYEKYKDVVNKEGKYLESMKSRSTHPVRLISEFRGHSVYRESQKLRQESRMFEEERINVRVKRGYSGKIGRVNLWSEGVKTNTRSCASDSTKIIGYESLLDISQISRRRN